MLPENFSIENKFNLLICKYPIVINGHSFAIKKFTLYRRTKSTYSIPYLRISVTTRVVIEISVLTTDSDKVSACPINVDRAF